jgi:hypothetical protein
VHFSAYKTWTWFLNPNNSFIAKLRRSKYFANNVLLSLMADSVLEYLLTKVDRQKRTVTNAYSSSWYLLINHPGNIMSVSWRSTGGVGKDPRIFNLKTKCIEPHWHCLTSRLHFATYPLMQF